MINEMRENSARVKVGCTMLQNSFFDGMVHSNILIQNVIGKWLEPHRFYHDIFHLIDLLDRIQNANLSTRNREILEIVAFYHDVVYNPKCSNNELASNEIFLRDFINITGSFREIVSEIIISTMYKNKLKESGVSKKNLELAQLFWSFDLHNFYSNDIKALMESETKIFREFQFVSPFNYRQGKMQFLDTLPNIDKKLKPACETLRQLVNSFRPNVGIYCGSFTPFTVGHLNIVEQAENIFNKVVIATGKDPKKKGNSSNYVTSETMPFHEVLEYNGYTTDFLMNYAATNNCDVTLIRGLRNGNDLTYEFDLLSYMKEMDKDVKTCYYLADKEFNHVSSSFVRTLEDETENSPASKYIPKKYNYIGE